MKCPANITMMERIRSYWIYSEELGAQSWGAYRIWLYCALILAKAIYPSFQDGYINHVKPHVSWSCASILGIGTPSFDGQSLNFCWLSHHGIWMVGHPNKNTLVINNRLKICSPSLHKSHSSFHVCRLPVHVYNRRWGVRFVHHLPDRNTSRPGGVKIRKSFRPQYLQKP